jgi:ubiquinone/menaquinone biosynthesis C-methylase UbiE
VPGAKPQGSATPEFWGKGAVGGRQHVDIKIVAQNNSPELAFCILCDRWRVTMAKNVQSTQSADHIAFAKAMFDQRASSYDASNGGWHVDLGRDFIEWSAPHAGATVLDLACGSGLVTYPAAKAVGPNGLVVGVDICTAMLREAKRKSALPGSGRIMWVEHDVGRLDSIKAVQDVVQKGGFDLITCCSALVMLPNPAEAIKHWAKFLKPGGRLIIDVPTEDKTVLNLWFNDLRRALGIPFPFNPDWIKDIHTLEKLFCGAGLKVERTWRTRSYLPEKWYREMDATTVLEEQVLQDKTLADQDKLQQARIIWPQIWKRGLRKDGRFWDGHASYVTIGINPSTD